MGAIPSNTAITHELLVQLATAATTAATAAATTAAAAVTESEAMRHAVDRLTNRVDSGLDILSAHTIKLDILMTERTEERSIKTSVKTGGIVATIGVSLTALVTWLTHSFSHHAH